MHAALLYRQDGGSDSSAPSLNPSLIVGICILGAIFFCVILASVIRLCHRMPARTSNDAEDPPQDLFRPHSQEQVERMREVRWLNHSEMWETAKFARMELGEQFGPKPKFNRRTGVGWGFIVGKDGYWRKADRAGEDAWSSHGTSGESRKSTTNDATTNCQQPRPNTYYEDCDPSVQYRQQRKPSAGQQRSTYDELDRSDDEGSDDVVTEPYPDLPQIPGIEQRFQQEGANEGRRHARMVRNDDAEQGHFANQQGPKIVLNDGDHDIGSWGHCGYGSHHNTNQAIEMRDLTEGPHAR